MKYLCLLLISFFSVSTLVAAEPHKTWNNKRAAVALTYDDALSIHLDTAVPALDQHGFRGTFYVTVSSHPFSSRIPDWRAIAQKGHELGNHTLFHPCLGGKGREWVDSWRDLSTWTLKRFIANIKITNTALEAVDGKTRRTFAYPCGDTEVGKLKESFVDAIKPLVAGARDVGGDSQTRSQLKSALYKINSHMVNNDTGKEMIQLVDQAIEQEALIVFLFHGVGGEHGLDVTEKAHAKLLAYLSKKEKELWVAPMIDIVDYVTKTSK